MYTDCTFLRRRIRLHLEFDVAFQFAEVMQLSCVNRSVRRTLSQFGKFTFVATNHQLVLTYLLPLRAANPHTVWRGLNMGRVDGERVWTPFTLLKCLRTHCGRHCEPFFSGQNAGFCIYNFNIYFRRWYIRAPQKRPWWLDPEPISLGSPAFHCSCFKKMISRIVHALNWIRYKLYRKNCIQSIQCCISRRSKTAKIKCYKL